MLENHQKPRRISLVPSRQALWASGLLFLFWLSFFIYVVSLDAQGLWRDEVDQLNFALGPLRQILANFTRAGWNGPLYPLILRGWVGLVGQSVFALRYFSALCGVLALVLLYKLTARRFGRWAGLFSLILGVTSPYCAWYAQEVKMYTWLLLLVLLALYALDRGCVEHRRHWWAVSLVATTLAVYSHILAVLFIPVAICWFLLHPYRHRRAWVGGLVVLALLTLPYLPLLRWLLPMVGEALLQGNMETGYPSYTLSQMIGILLNGWSVGVAGWKYEFGSILFGVLAAVGLVGLFVQKKPELATGLLIWVVLPLAVLWFVSLRRPTFTDRYLIWCLPAFYIAIGAGLVWISRFTKASVVLLLMTMVSLAGVNLVKQATIPLKPEFHKAAAYLSERRDPGDLLLFQIPYNHFVFDYYYEPPMDPWAKAPYTNWLLPEGGDYLKDGEYVNDELPAILGDHRDVWLVYSEVALWDARELVKQWLDEQGVLLEESHFNRVDIYHYRLRAGQVSDNGDD
ncbi:MAG: glycosyltransferase family 39 protein [Anaerolineae bacterium]|nr:glycosyltransferase family 39 protein [Anaerolineae bacterium]